LNQLFNFYLNSLLYIIINMTTHGTLDDELDSEDVEDVPLASHIILSVNMIERGSEPIDEINILSLNLLHVTRTRSLFSTVTLN